MQQIKKTLTSLLTLLNKRSASREISSNFYILGYAEQKYGIKIFSISHILI